MCEEVCLSLFHHRCKLFLSPSLSYNKNATNHRCEIGVKYIEDGMRVNPLGIKGQTVRTPRWDTGGTKLGDKIKYKVLTDGTFGAQGGNIGDVLGMKL